MSRYTAKDPQFREHTLIEFYSPLPGFQNTGDFPIWRCHQHPNMDDQVALHGKLWSVVFTRRRGPHSVRLGLSPTGLFASSAVSLSDGALSEGMLSVRFAEPSGRYVTTWLTRQPPQVGDSLEFEDGLELPVGNFMRAESVVWYSPVTIVVMLGNLHNKRDAGTGVLRRALGALLGRNPKRGSDG